MKIVALCGLPVDPFFVDTPSSFIYKVCPPAIACSCWNSIVDAEQRVPC